MKNFIADITGPDERILIQARLHWIYLVKGLAWCLLLLAAGILADQAVRRYGELGNSFQLLGLTISPRIHFITILFGCCGFFLFFLHLVKMLATEIALTDQRVIYKTGLLFIDVEEIDIVEIHAEHVHHGILGHLLGYGGLRLDSRFVKDIELPAVKDPYKLVKALHTAKGKIQDPLAAGSHK